MNTQPEPQPTDVSSPIGSARRTALLQSLGILLSGIVLGIAGVLLLYPRLCHTRSSGRHSHPNAKHIVENVAADLNLNSEQTTKMEAAYKEYIDRLNTLRQSMRPKIHEEITKLQAAVRDILTSEQFSTWSRQMEKRRKGFGKGLHYGSSPNKKGRCFGNRNNCWGRNENQNADDADKTTK